MILYLIKSSLCLLLLWAFYALFLERENIHFVKRYYLIFSLVFAFIVPLITVTYEVEVVAQPEVISEIVTPIVLSPEIEVMGDTINYTRIVLWSIYGIGVLIFGFRFIRNIIGISKKIQQNDRLKERSHINVLVGNTIVPHTFLKYIFVPKRAFQQKNIPAAVLLHEKTHVVQRHTLDILLVEILQVIFWFNPLLIFIKKSIKLNHEFLADQGVLKQQFSIHNYIEVLLNYPHSPNQAVVSSPINYSLTKKRLQMMTTNFSRKRVVLKLLALIPMLFFSMLFFNNKIVANEIELPLNENVDEEMAIKAVPEKEPIVVLKGIKEPMAVLKNNISAQDQDGVTKEMVKEYNNWAKDLNARIKKDQQITMRKRTLDRMQYIYKNMTSVQREQSEQFPEIDMPPPPPPPPPAPKAKEGEKNDIQLPTPPNTREIEEIEEIEKGSLPSPPAPKEIKPIDNKSKKLKRIKTEDGYVEILLSEKQDWTEEEQSVLKAQVQHELARERATVAREKAEIRREEAMLRVEESRIQQEIAMLSREEARQVAENARAIAMEAASRGKDAHGDRAQAIENVRISREAAEKARAMAMEAKVKAKKSQYQRDYEAKKAEMEARKNLRKAAMQARKAMKRAEMNARKAEMEVMKSARKAEMQAMQAERIASQIAEKNAPNKLIERMAKKDADFYYNKKQISAKEALKLVEDSNNTLSIDASTKNGKSKVIIKD